MGCFKSLNGERNSLKIWKNLDTPKFNTSCREFPETHKIGQHPELSGAVPHPSTDSYQIKPVPGAIKSLIRPLRATPATNSTQSQAGPDYKGPGLQGLENSIKNIAILIRPEVYWYILLYVGIFKTVFLASGARNYFHGLSAGLLCKDRVQLMLSSNMVWTCCVSF